MFSSVTITLNIIYILALTLKSGGNDDLVSYFSFANALAGKMFMAQ